MPELTIFFGSSHEIESAKPQELAKGGIRLTLKCIGKGQSQKRASGYTAARVSHSRLSLSQCKPSRGRKRGICWCVDKYGMKLPGMEYVDGDFQCHAFDSSNVE
jgi:hypothetical protein